MEAPRIRSQPRQPEPQHIHRNTKLPRPQPRPLSDNRRSAVASDNKISFQSLRLAILNIAHPTNPLSVPKQIGDLSAHDQLIARLPTTRIGNHIKEIPLRNETDVFMTAGQPRQIAERIRARIELDTGPFQSSEGE